MKKSTDEELETELIECDVIVRMPPKKRYKIQAVAKIIKKDELTIVESIYPKKNKEAQAHFKKTSGT
ncbi:MAG TPA: hypothetical protein PLL26_05720, partial [Candidatus Dojkabacteria bacterium]|nr:hypothetical protein [Candidatus Dojkabacteria bacterium]